jgi:hypothetical protein
MLPHLLEHLCAPCALCIVPSTPWCLCLTAVPYSWLFVPFARPMRHARVSMLPQHVPVCIPKSMLLAKWSFLVYVLLLVLLSAVYCCCHLQSVAQDWSSNSANACLQAVTYPERLCCRSNGRSLAVCLPLSSIVMHALSLSQRLVGFKCMHACSPPRRGHLCGIFCHTCALPAFSLAWRLHLLV